MEATTAPCPFLERQDQLAALDHQFGVVQRGKARIVAICADSGAGKSRLIEEFETRHQQEAAFFWGRAFSATVHTAYSVWIDALERYLRGLGRREALRALVGNLDVQRLFPSICAWLMLEPVPPRGGDVEIEQMRLLGQMSTLLTRLASHKPLVVVLDNLQWADRSSVELLHALIRSIENCPLLIVALYRAGGSEAEGTIDRCIVSLERIGLAERLVLPPLGLASVANICATLGGNDWQQQDLDALLCFTQGNPLFLWEYAKHIRDGGRQSPSHLAHGDHTVPVSIETLLKEQVQDLDEDSRRVLAVAAVIETDADYPLLRSVIGFDDQRLLDALDQLVAARFLEELTSQDVVYRFQKPLVQATIYGMLGVARRRFLHGLIARDLLARPSSAADASHIARHLLAGGTVEDSANALPHLVQAGRHAVSLFGNHEAVSLLSLALRIASGLPDATIPVVELRLMLGESHKRLGNFDEAIAVWSLALPQADRRQDAILRRSIARALWQSGREHDAMACLEEGVRTLPVAQGGPEGAWLRQEYALAKVRQGDLASALHEVEQVLATVDEEPEPELVARAYVVRSMAHGYRGDMYRAQTEGARALALSEGLPYPGAAFLASYTLAALSHFDGDPERFEALCAGCDRIAARMHADALESWSMSVRAARYTMNGRLREAISFGERAIQIDRSIGQGTMLPRTHGFLAVAHRILGDRVSAEANLSEAQGRIERENKTELRSVVVVTAARAYVDFLDGQFDRALGRIEDLSRRLMRPEPLAFYLLHPHVMPLAAEIAARAGDHSRASALLASIRGMQKGAFHPADAAIAHVSGLVAAREERSEEATRLLRKAVDSWSRQGRPFQMASARMDLADVLDLQGERRKAAEVARQALQDYTLIGAVEQMQSAQAWLRLAEDRLATGCLRRASGLPLSNREKEIAAAVASGRTNKEIARELGLSSLTVETHMKNILRKLGLRSRVQVATHVAQFELMPAGSLLEPMGEAWSPLLKAAVGYDQSPQAVSLEALTHRRNGGA